MAVRSDKCDLGEIFVMAEKLDQVISKSNVCHILGVGKET